MTTDIAPLAGDLGVSMTPTVRPRALSPHVLLAW